MRGLVLLSLKYLACICIILVLAKPAQAAAISAYTPLFRPVIEPGGGVQCQLRSFIRDGVAQALVVNPRTLQTRVIPQARLIDAATNALVGTPYGRALALTTAPPIRLQNHGLTHGDRNTAGHYLTVDLCPSKRPFEQAFFESVTKLAQPQPVPVTVAITGAWLLAHEQEFSWLREQERLGKLAVTWVNHSLTHPYDAAAPLQRTFLLTPGLDLRKELLDLEILLLEREVVPAPFFRFPGLVADEGAMRLVRELGLIPLGSDAWLAKGEHPRGGSIILVHGNGNEPAGMRRFQELLQQPGQLLLRPLPQLVADRTAS